MEDRNTLFGVPARAYKKPSEREIRENRKYMNKELRLKYEAAVEILISCIGSSDDGIGRWWDSE
jgi:hypothetical protein